MIGTEDRSIGTDALGHWSNESLQSQMIVDVQQLESNVSFTWSALLSNDLRLKTYVTLYQRHWLVLSQACNPLHERKP